MRIFTFLTTLLLATSLSAQQLPEGSRQLYYGMRQYESYGAYRKQFTIYEHQGKNYLCRELDFSGAKSIIVSDDDIAENAPYVNIPLTKRQVKTLRKTLGQIQFNKLAQECREEEQQFKNAVRIADSIKYAPKITVNENGDTLILLTAKERPPLRYHEPSQWQQDITWDNAVPDVHEKGTFSVHDKDPNTWNNNGHPARNAYLRAIDSFHATLHDMVFQYKRKHAHEDEMTSYTYHLSGGMRMLIRNGKNVRQGSEVGVFRRNGQWYVFGYVDEQEDTVAISQAEVRRIEEMVNKLDFTAMNPKAKPGEEVVRSDVSDAPSWRVIITFQTLDTIHEGDTRGAGFVEPAWMKEAYDKLLRQINDINLLLQSKLNLPWQKVLF